MAQNCWRRDSNTDDQADLSDTQNSDPAVRSRGVDELKMLLLMPQKFNIPTLKIRCLLETLGEVFDR